MANKNKKNASPHKILRWFFSLEVKILLVFLVLGILVIDVLIPLRNSEKEDLEFARVLILAMGALGGAYGLILATIRSVKFSDQVKTGQEQLFNQQLGQGATLLANGEVHIRGTGIRVLGDLAERTIGEIEQVELIMRTIHDFVHVNPSPSSGNEGRLDITLGIRTLVSLYKKSGQKTELKKLVQFQGCYFARLNFKDAELQGADFRGADFSVAELQGADFRGADFSVAKLQGADFDSAELQGADCTNADFSNATDLTEDQVKGMIFENNKLPILPEDLEKFLDPKCGYEWKKDSDDKSNRRYFVQPDVNAKESEKWKWSGKSVDEYLASIRNPKDDG